MNKVFNKEKPTNDNRTQIAYQRDASGMIIIPTFSTYKVLNVKDYALSDHDASINYEKYSQRALFPVKETIRLIKEQAMYDEFVKTKNITKPQSLTDSEKEEILNSIYPGNSADSKETKIKYYQMSLLSKLYDEILRAEKFSYHYLYEKYVLKLSQNQIAENRWNHNRKEIEKEREKYQNARNDKKDFRSNK